MSETKTALLEILDALNAAQDLVDNIAARGEEMLDRSEPEDGDIPMHVDDRLCGVVNKMEDLAEYLRYAVNNL